METLKNIEVIEKQCSTPEEQNAITLITQVLANFNLNIKTKIVDNVIINTYIFENKDIKLTAKKYIKVAENQNNKISVEWSRK